MPISANHVRYIKLGRSGRWEDVALSRKELHFGYGKTPHELALSGGFEAMKKYLLDAGKPPQVASREAREIADFYELGSDCLWITFTRDHLWWTFADPEVIWIGGDGFAQGERVRKCLGEGWRNTDVNGMPLRADVLSTALTKVAAYRRTVCSVAAQDYLLRRINGLDEPIVIKAARIRESMIGVVEEAIASLHWKDFETLVDIIFARNGWNRVSAVGGTQADIDLILEQPTTNERAAVQVKSAATQKTLDDYIARLDTSDQFDRIFFVCHSPKGALTAPAERGDIHIWTGTDLATTVLRTGLYDWVVEKAGSSREHAIS